MAGNMFAEMDFGGLYSVPVANAENQALELELQAKHKAKSDLENQISQQQETIQGLSEILQNIKQELLHTQALSEAVEKEAESKRHLKALAEQETGSLLQETAQLDKKQRVLTERMNTLEREILKGRQKMEKIKKQLDWDQQTIEDWLCKLVQEEEDTLVLVKYCRQDEPRIKEHTLRIEKTTAEINQEKQALDEERTHCITAQVARERVTENFSRALAERQEMIRHWENTVKQMRKRDCDLEQGTVALSPAHREVREKQSMVAEMKNQLEIRQSHNQQCEKKLAADTELARKLRIELQEKHSVCGQQKSEVEGLKSSVEQVATIVDARRSQLTSLQNDKDKSLKLKNSRLLLEVLEQKLKDVMESLISEDMLASILAQTLEEEELKSAELEAALLRCRMATSQKTQDLQVLKAKEQNLLTEISTARDLLKTTLRRHQNAEDDYFKNQLLIQLHDFQISKLEDKIRLQTEAQNSRDNQGIKLEISQLLKTLEERKKTSKMLSTQLRTFEIEVGSAEKAVEKVASQRRDLSSALEELVSCHEIAERELKKLVIKNQGSIVDQSLLKLDVKKITDRVQSERERVISLEEQKLSLEAAMKGEEVKVNCHRKVLQREVKIISQENQRLRMEMNEIGIRIDKMKKKYETIAAPIMPSDNDGGHSLACYIVQAAQEHEEVKRKCDQLDKTVSEKETEIRALENTLHAVNCRIELYKVPGVLSQSTEDYQKQLQLEERRKVEDENHKSKLRQIRELQQDIDGMNNTLDDLQQEEAALQERREECRTNTFSLKKELECQKKKLERATNRCSKVTRDIRSSKNTKSKTEEERDIDLSQLKEFDEMVERMLLEAMAEDTDLRSVLQMYFQEQNLPLPEPVFPLAGHLTPGLRSSSARSSSGIHLRSEFPVLQTPQPASQLSSAHSSLSSASSVPRPSQQQRPSGQMVDQGLHDMVPSAISSSPPRKPRRVRPATSRGAPKKRSSRKT